MDVQCSTCGEPWDVDHLWDDAVFETAVSDEETEAWRSLPLSGCTAPDMSSRSPALLEKSRPA